MCVCGGGGGGGAGWGPTFLYHAAFLYIIVHRNLEIIK